MSAHPPSLKNKNSPFSSFRQPQFSWLFASNMIFFLAMGGQSVVRAWLAFKLTDSEFALGMVMFAVAIPMLLFGPFGGAVADRVDRRNLIVWGQLVVFSSEVVICLLIFSEQLQFWHLLCAAGVNGSVFPFIMPARNAIIANIVGKLGLGKAMALNMAGMNTTRVLGPATAGLLIDAAGVGNTYLFGVLLYGVGLLCMTRVQNSPPSPEMKRTSVGRSIIQGVKYVRENRLVLVLLVFGLIPMLLAMPFQNLLVVFAEKIWDVGSRGLGLLSATMGIGGVVGSFWVATLGETQRRLKRMMISMLAFGFLLFCFAVSPYFLLGLTLVFLANIFANVYGTLNNTAIQILIPDQVRGRISSFLMMSFSLPLLGTLPVAAIAEVYGAPFAVALSSVLAVIVALVFYVLSPTLRNMDAGVKRAMMDGS
ncbi:MAG: MFS transporter [Deltaproteobacteria bacterium]|nr:MFS transporter [Deltaproteobacteria bacterium]